MLHKKIDKQIYLRERGKLGRVGQVLDATNYTFSKRLNSNVFIAPIQWTKHSYFFNRNLYGENINYNIEGFMNYEGNINKTDILTIEGGFQNTIKYRENCAYTCVVNTKRQINTTIDFLFNVFTADIYTSVALFYDNEWHNYSTFRDHRVKYQLSLPPNKSITIALLIYNSNSSICPLSVQIGFSNELYGWEVGGFTVMEPPKWILGGVYSSANPTTRNVYSNLFWWPPENRAMWAGNGVYRKEFEGGPHSLYKGAGNLYINNGIYLSSAEINGQYLTGKEIRYENIDYIISKSFEISANQIPNGAITSTADFNFSHTGGTGVVNGSTAYFIPYNSISNDGCIKFDVRQTDTSKTIYMAIDTSIPIGYKTSQGQNIRTYDIEFSCDYKYDSISTPRPFWKMMYWSSNIGTLCSTASSIIALSDTSTGFWYHNTTLLIPSRITATATHIPSDCLYLRPYFYAADGDTSYGVFYLDSIKMGYHTTDTLNFNSSSYPLTYLEINTALSVQINNHTFDLFMWDASVNSSANRTVVGNYNHTAYASCNVSVDESLMGGKFTGGLQVRRRQSTLNTTNHYSRNYVINGRFDGNIQDDSISFYNMSTAQVSYQATSDALYGDNVCRIIGNRFDEGIPTGIAKFGFNAVGGAFRCGGDTTWGVSAWIKKAKYGPNYIKLGLGPGIQAVKYEVHSAVFKISEDWQRFKFSTSWAHTSSTDNLIYSYVLVPEGESGIIYVDGLQTEVGHTSLPFITPFEQGKSIAYISEPDTNYIKVHSANTLFGNYGTMSFYWTPHTDSAGFYSGSASADALRKMTLWERYKEADNYYKIEWSSAYSGYRFIQSDVTTIHSVAITNRQYHTNQPVFIGLRWTPDRFYFQIDTARVDTARYAVATVDDMYFGCSSAQTFFADGIYSHLRMDTCCWDVTLMSKQARAWQYSPDSYSATHTVISADLKHLVDVDKAGQGSVCTYNDSDGLVNSKLYAYYLDAYDHYGIRSGLSSAIYVNAGDTTAPYAVSQPKAVGKNGYIIYSWKTPNDRSIEKTYVFKNKLRSLNSADSVLYAEYGTEQEYIWGDVDSLETKNLYVICADAWNNIDTGNTVIISGQPQGIPKNFIVSGSFERIDQFNKIVGWDGRGAADIASRFLSTASYEGGKFRQPFGKYCVGFPDIIDSDTLYSSWLSYPKYDSAIFLTLSCWAWDVDLPTDNPFGGIYFGIQVAGDDGFYDLVAGYLGYTGEHTTIYSPVGHTVSTWYQYATTFAATVYGATTAIIDRMRILHPYNIALPNARYIDNVQFEYGSTATTYEENVGMYNQEFPGGAISGVSIQDNTLKTNKFKDGIVSVGVDTSAGNQFLIGAEESGASFVSMTHTQLRYHPPNMTTSSGYAIITHVENGNANYGAQVIFDKPYQDMSGNFISPTIFTSPRVIFTYSQADSGSDQRLFFNDIVSSASSFVHSATLRRGAIIIASASDIGSFFWLSLNSESY